MQLSSRACKVVIPLGVAPTQGFAFGIYYFLSRHRIEQTSGTIGRKRRAAFKEVLI